jgi:hypothetical protein
MAATTGWGRQGGRLVVQQRGHGVAAQPIHGSVEFLDGAVQPQAAVVERVAVHQVSWWQTGQTWRAARRSQRAWLWALASWNPQVGQEATHWPASRCSAAGWSPSSARSAGSGWAMAVSGSQRWWVIAAAAVQGSGQATAAKHRSQVTARAPSSVGVV